jgi:hypothetical protein
VLNLIATDPIEQRMLGTLDAKRTLAEGVLDLKGDLSEVPLRPGGQSFLQRLEQTISTTPAIRSQTATGSPQRPPADPSATFARRAGALLGSRLVDCVERYPDTDDSVPPVLLVTVDRDAEAWQPRLALLQAELFAGAQAAPRLEVLDRATVQALERLEAAGLVVSRVRATRHLQPAAAAAMPPLSDEEKARATTFRQQAAKKLKLARILAAEDLADESVDALREAARLGGCAFAVEERVAKMPSTLREAIAPPLDRRWGEARAGMCALAENTGPAAPNLLEALRLAIEPAMASPSERL